jgi:hypothetical protein
MLFTVLIDAMHVGSIPDEIVAQGGVALRSGQEQRRPAKITGK